MSDSFDQATNVNSKNIKVSGFSNKSLQFKNKFGEQ